MFDPTLKLSITAKILKIPKRSTLKMMVKNINDFVEFYYILPLQTFKGIPTFIVLGQTFWSNRKTVKFYNFASIWLIRRSDSRQRNVQN